MKFNTLLNPDYLVKRANLQVSAGEVMQVTPIITPVIDLRPADETKGDFNTPVTVAGGANGNVVYPTMAQPAFCVTGFTIGVLAAAADVTIEVQVTRPAGLGVLCLFYCKASTVENIIVTNLNLIIKPGEVLNLKVTGASASATMAALGYNINGFPNR